MDNIKNTIKPNVLIRANFFPEDLKVLIFQPFGSSYKLVGQGMKTSQTHSRILTEAQLGQIEIISKTSAHVEGEASRFRLGVEAMRLGLAYEYDPYFSLSIARVDPLPHQLEAVYEYFLKTPRIRFLLADDPGAGKTIMAGLLIKELKIRGLIERVLIITPANLTFQWQREMKDKFRENFEIIRGDILRANYGMNPWMEKNQVVTSVSWVSTIDDAKESLLRSRWDLVIVDEAHKMSAADIAHQTLAYQLGRALSELTDHYLLMTATPHKGDPKHFCLFLELLDKDVYGNVESLEEAMRRQSAPFYLRRVKEALVSFPDPESGIIKKLFTKRNVSTTEFQINNEEADFYDALTRYVEDQSIKAAADNSVRGRALGFTMAMLQRRFASSIYAVRRSLERMVAKRELILKDPDKYRQQQIESKLPDDFEEMTDEEQQRLISQLEDIVASFDPVELKEEIVKLNILIKQAKQIEEKEIETKLLKLKQVMSERGIFEDKKMKLLIFTEHKDTLDYLVGDGLNERPLGKLIQWGLETTQIHGGMKIGSRDEPGTRLYSERMFRENAQILVATEAAGEGINLQFCWFLINYDIPWNPVRLEQRMGRIHRYGQEKDCLIFNFVSTNTREGRVLQKLFERINRIEDDLDPDRTGKVFNVLGDIFPSNQLERMLRDMYSRNLTEDVIKDRIIKDVDTQRFNEIANSTLEGLAKKELNLSAIVGKSEEAKERRLVPEVIEDFFMAASPVCGFAPKPNKHNPHIYKVGKIPRVLWRTGDRLEPKFGKLGHEYSEIVFDKKLAEKNSTCEWVTPGHSLFETVRESILEHVINDMHKGAVFYDLHRKEAARLDVFSVSFKDGIGNTLHKKLYVTQTSLDGSITIHQPTIFLDFALGLKDSDIPEIEKQPSIDLLEETLIETTLLKFLEEIKLQRQKDTETIERHVNISLNAIIDKEQLKF